MTTTNQQQPKTSSSSSSSLNLFDSILSDFKLLHKKSEEIQVKTYVFFIPSFKLYIIQIRFNSLLFLSCQVTEV